MSVNRLKIYLAGGKSDWRDIITTALPNLEYINPFSMSKRSVAEITNNDCTAIDSADMVIFCVGYPEHRDGCLEIGYAYAKGKTVVLIWVIQGSIPPMVAGVSRKIFLDFDSAITWLTKEYGEKKQ